MYDPYNPKNNYADILGSMAAKGSSITDLIAATDRMSGRWALVLKNSNDFVVVHDPCGLRQVYYHTSSEGIWCGSQPAIIAANTTLQPNNDPRIREFINSAAFIDQEGAWVGEMTPYADCFHLLPNHYLDLRSGSPVRYFPCENLLPINPAEAIQVAVPLLKGTIEAVICRNPAMLPVTAGWDSRVILAASRDWIESINCYVDRMGTLRMSDADVQIPLRLSSKLGFQFTVKNSDEPAPPWFLDLLRHNVTGATTLPKTRSIYANWRRDEKKINLNGNCSEICRNFYDKYGSADQQHLSIGQLADLFGFPKSRFVHDELERWKAELGCCVSRNIQLLDMLYWEQRMGNWGGQYLSEQDIAIEQISPFNNRRLIKTLLSVPTEFRVAPHFRLYHDLIDHLWPESLSEPLNPKLLPRWMVESIHVCKGIIRRWLPETVLRTCFGYLRR